MNAVDAGLVAWLKEGAMFSAATDAAAAARWGSAAAETEILSPLALVGGAEAEAARQLDFLRGPLAVEQLDVAGSGVELIGTVRTIVADALGYGGGLDVFVIGYADGDTGRTTLTVLRRL